MIAATKLAPDATLPTLTLALSEKARQLMELVRIHAKMNYKASQRCVLMNNNWEPKPDNCPLPVDHPMHGILAPMRSKLKEIDERSRTPEAIAQKQQRKREILRSQGLLVDD